MRGIRLVILIIAGIAAVAAIALVKSALDNNSRVEVVTEREEIKVTEQVKKTNVLVAARDLKMGETLTPDTLSWQVWPADSVSPAFITQDKQPNIKNSLQNSAVRSYIVAGEPITEAKLLKLDNASVMSVMLRPGMRAISLEISPETGAGGFILPGDYVDVLLTTRLTNYSSDSASNAPAIKSQPILEGVRVLAIDQIFNTDASGSGTAVGRTATLEVFPEQATIIAKAEEAGVVTLILRGISELLNEDGTIMEDPMPITSDESQIDKASNSTAIIVLRNGKATKIIPNE